MDRREQLVSVFADTQAYYTENCLLADAVLRSRKAVKLYEENDYPELPEEQKAGSVSVTKSKTFEAAMRLHNERPSARIAVLNFASATNPGGGVKSGSSAQEESLCRCSTLYPTLNQRWLWDQYYLPNREANDSLHTDVCIYSPEVVICKTDESIPQRLPEEQFVTVDVITCAAPNLRQRPGNYHNPDASKAASITRPQLFDLHVKRAKHILHVAAANGVDCLVLGAFGCGAFMNDPHYVAAAYRDALEEYRAYFDVVEFAIYCRGSETENYRAFAEKLQMYTEK
jgi:uncharacterized protein (TIGR02452 family)